MRDDAARAHSSRHAQNGTELLNNAVPDDGTVADGLISHL
jgi:hypothetical protein